MAKKFHFINFYNEYCCRGNIKTKKLYKVNCSYCLDRINEIPELKQKYKISKKHFLKHEQENNKSGRCSGKDGRNSS